MQFYTKTHSHYCGIDLHAKTMYRLAKTHGKGKALSILAHRIGRAIYFMLKRKRAFDLARFLKA